MTKQTPYEYMMKALERARKTGIAHRTGNGDLEHEIQCECARMFRAMYPKYEKVLFAVPTAWRTEGMAEGCRGAGLQVFRMPER